MCSPSAPSTQSSTVDLPDWAKPYAKDTLAKGAALTDTSKNPYPVYGGNRIAGFQPLQQQAFNTVSGLNAGPQGFAQGIGDYMSPYMQNVVDIEKREAGRQSGIAGTQQQAQATQAGAFGGGRDAIMRAERERNLGQQMGDIQAKGSQAAYEQAANQFRQGITQQSGLATQEAQLGQQQQQQAQRPLDVAYQDFQNQQNYPYKQLGYMADLIHGLPLGQKSTQAVYEGAPSPIQTVGALGMGAYGASKLFGANGGLMDSYAGGGMVAFGDGGDTDVTDSPMDDPTEMAKAVADLSDEQLQQIIQHPSSAAELQAAKTEMATRASENRGLASAYNMMPQQAPTTQATPQAPMMQAAKGGIMGFDGEDGSVVTDDKLREILDENNQEAGYDGNPEDYAYYRNEGRRLYGELANEKSTEAMTDEQRRAETRKNYGEVESMAGPAPYKAQADRIAGLETQQLANLEQQKGLAALAAIPEVLKGGNAMRGIGAGAGAFGGMYGKAIQADRAEKLSLMSAKNNLEEAQYKMKVGMVGDARQLTAESRRDRQAAEAARIAKLKALGVLAAANERANRPVKGATPNFDIQNRDTMAADLRNTTPMKTGETEAQYDTRLKAMAAREIYGAKGTKDITSRADIHSNVTSTSDIKGTKGDIEQQKADTGALAAEAASLDKARAELNKLKKSRDARNQKKWQDLVTKNKGDETKAGEEFIKGYMVKPADAAPAAPVVKPAAPISKLQTPEDFAKQTNADPSISKEAKASMIARYKSGYPSALADEKARAKPATAPAAKPAAAPSGKVLTQADIAATAKASGKTIDEVKAQAKLKGYTIQ